MTPWPNKMINSGTFRELVASTTATRANALPCNFHDVNFGVVVFPVILCSVFVVVQPYWIAFICLVRQLSTKCRAKESLKLKM